MTGVSTVFAALASCCMVTNWWAVRTGRTGVEALTKPSVMLALLGVAFTADLDPTSLRPWIVFALVFGLAGDVALLPQVDRFIVGLGAFLVGHLAYVGAFVAIWSPSAWIVAGVVGLAALIGSFGLPIDRGLRGDPMHAPVLAYIAVIGAMILTASGTGRWPIVVGALAFAASDGLIGIDKFVKPAPERRVWILVLYHLGQGAIIAGTIAS